MNRNNPPQRRLYRSSDFDFLVSTRTTPAIPAKMRPCHNEWSRVQHSARSIVSGIKCIAFRLLIFYPKFTFHLIFTFGPLLTFTAHSRVHRRSITPGHTRPSITFPVEPLQQFFNGIQVLCTHLFIP